MKLRQKVCMRNMSGFKAAAFFALLTALASTGFAASAGEIKNAAVDKFEQTAKPLFNLDAPAQAEKPKADPFFDKIRGERSQFEKEEQKRQREFVNQARSSNWSDDERQKKIQEFSQKKIERRRKFIQKEQKKIDKHLGN